jgi:HD-GYP domain-containing protein (c-di-GMP phosphodiesterase class II)/HAMP domain-containing protein
MTASNIWIRASVLRSKVARRLFLVFVLCALLPLTVLAVFSYSEVRSHLENLSDRRLHQASKSTGMTIVERLSFLETDLHLIGGEVLSEASGRQEAPVRRLGSRIDERFSSLAVLGADGRVALRLSGQAAMYPRLTDAEQDHVRAGRALVTIGPGSSGGYTVYVARLVDPGNAGRGLLIGAVSPDYLWGGESFLSPGTELCVLGQGGELLFSSRPGVEPPRALVKDALEKQGPSGRFEWSHEHEALTAGFWTMFMRPTHLTSWLVVQSEPRDEVQAPLRKFAWTFSLIVLCAFWIVLFASLNQIRRRMVPIEHLMEATHRVRDKVYSHRVKIESDDEFADLGASFNAMTESMALHVDVMDTINRIGVSLSAERDEAALIETVLCGAQDVFNADGAFLFLMSKQGRLELSQARLASLAVSLSGPAGVSPGVAGAIDAWSAAWAGGIGEGIVVSADVHADGRPEFAPLIEFDRQVAYRSRSFLSVPLRNHENDVIGVLQLMNARARSTREVVSFSDEDQRLAASLASQAAVALTKNRLIEDFKGLFEGLTELVSTAIDEQSPYTGGHVRRVVVLSRMIAEALPRSASSRLRDAALSEDELYELRIAALLHDCGKLTMPVHVTDKATKLQSIFDRIELVEARAEVLRRQHRIDVLERALLSARAGADPGQVESAGDGHDEFERQLDEDLAVLRACNEGNEHTPTALRDRALEAGRRYRWTNARHEEESLVSEDELYHLSVLYGTLTAEERAVIHRHVVTTIAMLERLPYPRNLRNVPRYAGTHHERLNGTGYPFGLSNGDIPIQGQIIGVADVLEALTARDRPYKLASDVPEAMGIMARLVREGAVDRDLYDLLVSERILEKYAVEYLAAPAEPVAGVA